MTRPAPPTPPVDVLSASGLQWALMDPDLNVVQASREFVISLSPHTPLPRPLPDLLPNLSADEQMNLRYLQDRTSFQLVSVEGRGLHCIASPTGSDQFPVCLTLMEFSLDDRWLMDLHPNYNHALYSSDQWLGHLESIIKSAPEETLNQLAARAVDISHSRGGYLMHYRPELRQLRLTARYPDQGDTQDAPFAIDRCPALAACVDDSTAYICNDIDAQPLPFLAGQEVRSHLCVPINYRGSIVGVLGVLNRDTPYTEVDAKSLMVFGTLLWHALQLPKTLRVVAEQSRVIRQQKQQLNHSLIQLVGAIADALEVNDPYTAGHQRSVAKLAHRIGRRMGLSPHQLEGLKLGGLVHDIGKLAIPSQLLTKPSRLSGEEFDLIKTHAERGAEIIKEVEFPWPIREMILQHHERLDGSGYPFGLKGEQLLVESQILAVADVSDSILSHRPYRPALGYEKLQEVLLEGRGSQFNSDAVDICLALLCQERTQAIDCVEGLSLGEVLRLGLDDTLATAEEQMKQADLSVALVMDDDGVTVRGFITNAMLTFWHSPLLDTAAERTLDRELQHRRLHQVMKHDVPQIERCASLESAAVRLQSTEEHFLLVNDARGQPQGILTWPTLARALQEKLTLNQGLNSTERPLPQYLD
ncbi:HD domain-containing protein [Ferrimonas sediminicola]|uniref:HD domain-containing protein n=1 Tax=Ferrimonas sediminicola TaxID=2569538 RepID=A0A4U1BC37_9GAMM|nr:HD domain-containing phosphohydrolase [Ferrimonas sediminicola]TKB48405.1 HD domain-containing protein [Ferrimonas sediminicola]